jgi:hypothetical protein
VERQRHGAGGDAGAAGGDDRPARLDALDGKTRPELCRRQQGAVAGDEIEMGQIETLRNMAAPQARARLGLSAGEAPGRPRVDHLLAPGDQIGADLLEVAHQKIVLASREMGLARDHRAVVHRPPLGQPFCQPAVEHRDVRMAEQAQHPPDARARRVAVVVVDHDSRAVAQP